MFQKKQLINDAGIIVLARTPHRAHVLVGITTPKHCWVRMKTTQVNKSADSLRDLGDARVGLRRRRRGQRVMVSARASESAALTCSDSVGDRPCLQSTRASVPHRRNDEYGRTLSVDSDTKTNAVGAHPVSRLEPQQKSTA